jgi:hypothetical protein
VILAAAIIARPTGLPSRGIGAPFALESRGSVRCADQKEA